MSIPGDKVVGQYFGLFHGCEKDHYDTIVKTAPFDCCNLLILGFLDLWQTAGTNQNLVQLPNSRDNCFNGGKAKDGDTDEDRIRLVLDTARARNPNLKILISMGWYTQVVKASQTPGAFAYSLAAFVDKYKLDGFDIDWETHNGWTEDPFAASDFVNLMQWVKKELGNVMDNPILTLCPAILLGPPDVLDKSVLDCFTYVMPQSYKHGGDGTRAEDYAVMAGGGTANYDKIVYGLSGEGFLDPPNVWMPDNPEPFVQDAKSNGAAGVFSWRLDTDTLPKARPTGKTEGPCQLPRFDVARKMWQLMGQQS